MNLRELAESDNSFLIEDSTNGFGVAIKLTDLQSPTPNVYEVFGQYHRVGVEIDPETGLQVAGNKSAVTVRISSLGGAIPEDGWTIETTDILGATVKGKATMVLLDRTAGRATMVMRK